MINTDYTDSLLISQIYNQFPFLKDIIVGKKCFEYLNFEFRYCLEFRISKLGFTER